MEIVKEVENLKANGHYAIAITEGTFIFLSGQFAVDMETGEKKFGTIEEETLRVLRNIEKILLSMGSCKEKVLKVNIYINDLKNWDSVNAIYSEFFGNHYPARTIASVKELHFGFQLEMDVIACK